ncbi:MAG: ABC transporter ATP-binding protein, partial [Nitrospirales bacterium]
MADLELRGIQKTFPGVTVLQDVSLRVTDGEFTILLGPSGCGKSTLLRIIAGLERQTAGSVQIGQEVVDARSPGDRDIAMVFQHYALYPHFTVRENLAFGLKMRKVSRDLIDERIRDAAQLLDIEPLLDRKPKELSGGQRQRVAMGRAIVRKPKLFLFDEPLSNLDARLRASMRVELKKLHQRLRATIIYVTHDQVEAMTLGDKIVIMDRGRIRQVDSPAQVYAKPADPFVAAFVGTPGMNLLEGALVGEDSGWSFVSEEIRISLPRLAGPPPEQPGNQVVFGMRPEDIRLTPSEGTESQLTAEVEVVEDLGAELVLHVSAGRHRLVVRTSPDERVKSGDG